MSHWKLSQSFLRRCGVGSQQNSQQKKKGSDVQGRNAAKCARYSGYDHQMKVKERKLARILKSSGPEAALNWAKNNDATNLLNSMAQCGIVRNSSTHKPDSKIAQLAKKATGQ